MLSSIKSFAISFAVGIIIFGLIAYFIAPQIKSLTDGFLTPQAEETGEAQEYVIPDVPEANKNIDDKNAKFPENRSFTMLLVGSDYQPDVFSDYRVSVQNTAEIEQLAVNNRHYKADVVMVVRYNSDSGVTMFSAIPTSLMVTAGGIQMRLCDVLERKSISYFSELVAGIIGMPIDYYICCQISLFDDIIDRLGGIKYDVPTDMYYVNEEERIVTPGSSREPIPLVINGEPVIDSEGNPVMILAGKAFTINLKRGIQTLDGEKATWVLRYNVYANGFISRRDTLVSFFRAFFEQFATEEKRSALTGIISLINTSAAGSTNMTPSDFEEIANTLLSYSKYEKTNVVFPCTVSGSGENERSSFSRNTAYATYEKFKLK